MYSIEEMIIKFAEYAIYLDILDRIKTDKISEDDRGISFDYNYLKEQIYLKGWKTGISRKKIRNMFMNELTPIEISGNVQRTIGATCELTHLDGVEVPIGFNIIKRKTVYYITIPDLFQGKPIDDMSKRTLIRKLEDKIRIFKNDKYIVIYKEN